MLDGAGYDRAKRTLFVWQGVTFYIPEEAVDSTLRFVTRHSAPGSRIVLDYFVQSALKAPAPPLQDVMKRLQVMREPLIFGLPDQGRQEFITSRGLTIVSDVPMNELRPKYLPLRELDATPELGRARGSICTAAVP